MRTLAFLVILVSATVQAIQWIHPRVAIHDNGCSGIPKLCTDLMMLHGYQTTLTYLCPETKSPTVTLTVTTTVTTTVTPNATSATSFGCAKTTSSRDALTSDEPATTTAVHSTMQITIAEITAKTGASPVFSLITPVITASFSAIPLSDAESLFPAKPTLCRFESISSAALSISELGATTKPTFNPFPSHSVANPSSAVNFSWTASMPLANITSSHSAYNFPALNAMKVGNSTGTVTTTAAVVTTTNINMASRSRASLIALFLGIMTTVLLF